LYNCTVSGNTASDLADGTYRGSLYNTIVWPDAVYNSSQYSCWINDPLFIGAPQGNFRLQIISPCIDSGNNTYVKTADDLAGNSRVLNGTVDVGAYEFSMNGFALSIDGASIVNSNSTNEFACRLAYSNEAPVNITDQAVWSILGDAHGTALNSNELSVGTIASNATVSIQAVYGSLTNTHSVLLKVIPPGLTYLGSLDDDQTADVVGTIYSNGYAYAACGYAGVIVFDVSDPANPVRVGGYDTDGEAWRFDMRSNLLFVADSRFGMTILDVSDPVNPILAGEWQEPSSEMGLYDVAVSGDYAYLAATDRGMLVIDISDTSNPTLVAEYDDCRAQGLTVDGNYAYIVDSYDLLQIVDISTPSNPLAAGDCWAGAGHELMVQDGYAYVGAGGDGLQVVNVSDPMMPVPISSYSLPWCWNMFIEGTYVYLPDGYKGIKIIDISNPYAPVLAGEFDDVDGASSGLYVAEGKAYVGNQFGGVYIADVSDPAAAIVLGSYDTHRYARDVEVKGSYAYLAAWRDGMVTVDISNPENPIVTATNKWNNSPYDKALDIVGDYAYVAGRSWGLGVFDLSIPSNPSLITKYDLGHERLVDVKVSGDYVFCANERYDEARDSTSALCIIDISNPSDPVLVGGYNTGGIAYGVDIQGSYAYLASHTNGLQIFDISNPSNPVLHGVYASETDSYAGQVEVFGDYAYVLNNKDVLQIINISNSDTPTCTAILDLGSTGANGANIFVQIPYVYIAFNNWGSGQNGLWIVDVSDPASPVAVTNYPTSGFGEGVAVANGQVYLADKPKALHTFTWGAVPTPVKSLTSVSVIGSDSISIGETNAYSCQLEYSDQSFKYETTSALWNVVGDAHDTVLDENVLTADAVSSNAIVTIQGSCQGYSNSLAISVFYDKDNNGIPDWWERLYYGGSTRANPSATCSNGVNSVWEAYIAGLNPNDPNSAFLTSVLPGQILQWPCVSGRVYSVWWTTNLLDGFQPLETNIPWTHGGYTNPDALPSSFYKINVQLDE